MRFRILLLAGTGWLSAWSADPLPSSADAPLFSGRWSGDVIAPNAVAEIGFTFRPTAKGTIVGLYMPAMFLYGAELGPAEIDGATLRFRPLDIVLTREGERIVGTFGLSHLPVDLLPGGEFEPAPPKPQYPPAPDALWRASLEEETWASPVVSDGMVFIGTAAGNLHVLSAATGERSRTIKHSAPIHGAPLIAGDRAYLVDANGTLAAFATDTGALEWQTPLHATAAGQRPRPANETFNRRTPVPVLVDRMLYVGSSDGHVYALDAETGRVHWRQPVNAAVYATVGFAGDTLWVGAMDGSVIALDRASGRERQRTRLPGPVVSTPVAIGDRVIVGCRNYSLYGLGELDLKPQWRHTFWFSWIESVPAVDRGTLYIGGSDYARVSATDATTGETHWATVVHGLTWGTPVVTADTVYAGTSAQRGAILPHEGGIVALERRTGTIRWRLPLPRKTEADRAGIIGSLAHSGDRLIAATFDGEVIALPITPAPGSRGGE